MTPNPRWWQQQWETAKEMFPKEAAIETIEVRLPSVLSKMRVNARCFFMQKKHCFVNPSLYSKIPSPETEGVHKF